ncbi:head-proximal tip of tail tube tail completion + sheath stabilizer protein [Prochlorococcus phage P-SSM7]|uniref:Head-proximal tip of tail tube tail completion + sheath stabilizer protein n=1 Tax=Prochlorococcus phage P-SSM7 TaxID=445688 RepID=E3SNP6_9CAUD|nr:head-proximal tip of tail tube tail completion + sheath stabilizer protein [Prochlorococcus phage P-SSM7]ADO98975.1 head-proximal tip of tail tube tail completion + sheath stabilizer protein [Prochlorococcus phage P-SSM7]
MANWYSDQLTNRNFLSPIGFLFLLDKARKVSFLCQKAEIPTVELGQVEIPTRGLVPIPVEGNMRYSEFSMEFIVDEDLRNYMQIHNWMRALGTPQEFKERRVWIDKYADSPSEDPRFSDATLQVLNNNNIANFDVVFKDMFPVSLSSLPFDVTGGDNDYFTSTATFRYTLYEIRNTNSQTKR